MTEDAAALESIIAPLINAICPAKVKEPKEKIAIVIRELLKEQLGNEKYVSIVDRFIIGNAEKNPIETIEKLKTLHVKLGEILHEV